MRPSSARFRQGAVADSRHCLGDLRAGEASVSHRVFCETLFLTLPSLTYSPQSPWAFSPETAVRRSPLRVERLAEGHLEIAFQPLSGLALVSSETTAMSPPTSLSLLIWRPRGVTAVVADGIQHVLDEGEGAHSGPSAVSCSSSLVVFFSAAPVGPSGHTLGLGTRPTAVMLGRENSRPPGLARRWPKRRNEVR
jgi:hypothetical protein